MDKKCTATVMVADATKPSENIEKRCGKDAYVGIDTDNGKATFYLCERHYQEYLPQIEAWLGANAESEDDECSIGDDHINEGCPDCRNDESEDYSEPRPEDEELPNTYKDFRPNLDELREEIGEGMTGYIEWLEAVINELKTELKSCWENQQEYKAHVAELMEKLQDVRKERNEIHECYLGLVEAYEETADERDNLQERIEEARITLNQCDVERAKEILTPDSDEGDGSEAEHA